MTLHLNKKGSNYLSEHGGQIKKCVCNRDLSKFDFIDWTIESMPKYTNKYQINQIKCSIH